MNEDPKIFVKIKPKKLYQKLIQFYEFVNNNNFFFHLSKAFSLTYRGWYHSPYDVVQEANCRWR